MTEENLFIIQLRKKRILELSNALAKSIDGQIVMQSNLLDEVRD